MKICEENKPGLKFSGHDSFSTQSSMGGKSIAYIEIRVQNDARSHHHLDQWHK